MSLSTESISFLTAMSLSSDIKFSSFPEIPAYLQVGKHVSVALMYITSQSFSEKKINSTPVGTSVIVLGRSVLFLYITPIKGCYFSEGLQQEQQQQ
jgi:hypothetical protein